MQSEFDEAVDIVAIASEGYVSSGRLELPKREIGGFLFEAALGIRLVLRNGEEDGADQTPTYFCSDRAAKILYGLCDQRADAFELAKKISAQKLISGEPLPRYLQKFAGLYIANRIRKPKSTRQSLSLMRNLFLLSLIRAVEKQFNLSMTRADESERQKSACDAVSAGLKKNGHHLTYRALKELCVGSKPEQKRVREEFNEWVKLLALGRANGTLSEEDISATWIGLSLL